MKSKINFLLAALTLIIVLQSCLKDHHPVIQLPDDKLLLSKVTGQSIGNPNAPVPWNLFEFRRDSSATPFDHIWKYYAAYSYGSGHIGWDNYKPIKQIAFYNTGSWDFTYSNSLPDKVIDNSKPGLDQGYWKFYYNNKGQIIKTGLAFSTTTEPTEFEFYGYDDHNNLTDLVFGQYVDTPRFKLTFTYDANDNLTQWQYLFSNGYTNADIHDGQKTFFSAANSLETEKAIGKPLAEMLKRISAKQNSITISTRTSSFKIPPTRLLGDSNVIYENYLTATITNDGRINPYHQQDRILYFITSRYYSPDIDCQFLPLQKSNAVNIQYILNPDFGPVAPMTSNSTYTYNRLGYPVTSHEEVSDPEGVWLPYASTYTQDRNYEYISNH